MRVRWRNRVSGVFGVKNGVQQGSILSPGLFNHYINELLEQLKGCGEGARLGHLYVGCLAYADDIILVSPTVYGMEKMLKVCDQFAASRGMMFNAKKSVSMTFIRSRYVNRSDPGFALSGHMLSCQSELSHLGVVWDMFNNVMVEHRVKKFYGAVNASMAKVGGWCLYDNVWLKILD